MSVPPCNRDNAIHRAADRLGLARKKQRKPPPKSRPLGFALLSALSLTVMLATSAGIIHDISVGLFGGSGGAWLAGRKAREDARRDGRLDSI